MQFSEQLSKVEGQFRVSLDAMECLSVGITLLDAHGRIVALNQKAVQILAQNDGLIMNKGIAAALPAEAAELRSSITAAAITAKGRGFSSGGHLAISRPSGKRPFAILVMPASPGAFAPEVGGPAVIIFISDPEEKASVFPEVLARAYGLTVAESRLAELLMQGEDLVRAADRLGVSHNTVRTHLQRIYQKTGTCHQGDLVRLLLTGLPMQRRLVSPQSLERAK